MYLHWFLLLFSSGACGYFLPLEETLHLQNKTKHSIIDEMLCLLEAENDSIKKQFLKPLHIKDQNCAHSNTEKFIRELKEISTCECMKIVEEDMKELEDKCYILKKSSSNDKRCFEMVQTNFTRFKESLKEFLKWVNQKQNCSNIARSELGLYSRCKCSCPHPWQYPKGSL